MTEPMKVALVTGGGTGIGSAVSLALAGERYRVVIAGRRRQPLEDTAAAAHRAGGQVLAIPTDVTSPQSVAELFNQTRETFGRLDLLFNNAGVFPPSMPLEDITHDEWQSVFDTNVTGSFLCAQQAFRLMKHQDPRGGRIINNGSLSAHTPRLNSAPYTAAKHAITGLTKSLSLDGRRFDIACGQIDIGNALTDMTKDLESRVEQADGTRLAEPHIAVEHVVRAVLYMASLPLEANVLFITVMATRMPFAGRG